VGTVDGKERLPNVGVALRAISRPTDWRRAKPEFATSFTYVQLTRSRPNRTDLSVQKQVFNITLLVVFRLSMWGMHLALISCKLIAGVGAVEGQQLTVVC
jgi:hypothetical protein